MKSMVPNVLIFIRKIIFITRSLLDDIHSFFLVILPLFLLIPPFPLLPIAQFPVSTTFTTATTPLYGSSFGNKTLSFTDSSDSLYISVNDSYFKAYQDHNINETAIQVQLIFENGSIVPNGSLEIDTLTSLASTWSLPFRVIACNESTWILLFSPIQRYGFAPGNYTYRLIGTSPSVEGLEGITTIQVSILKEPDTIPPQLTVQLIGGLNETHANLTQSPVNFTIHLKDNQLVHGIAFNSSKRIVSLPIEIGYSTPIERHYSDISYWSNRSDIFVNYTMSADQMLNFGTWEGFLEFHLFGTDEAINVVTSSPFWIFGDNMPPRITIHTPSDNVQDPKAITLEWSVEDAFLSSTPMFSIWVDSNADGYVDTLLAENVTDTHVTVSMPENWTLPSPLDPIYIKEGWYPYLFAITTTDRFGNEGSMSKSIRLEISSLLIFQSSLSESTPLPDLTTYLFNNPPVAQTTYPSTGTDFKAIFISFSVFLIIGLLLKRGRHPRSRRRAKSKIRQRPR